MRGLKTAAIAVFLTVQLFFATGCLEAFFDLEDESVNKPSYLTLDNKVKEIQPADKATSVTVGSSIFITFNRPMDRESVRVNFSISPHHTGKHLWPSDYILKFTPDSNLKHDTLYTIKVDKKAKDVVGNEMAATFESTFGTPMKSPEVFSTYPTNIEQNVPRTANIYINFSEPVDKTDSANAFRISPSLLGDFSWDDDDTLKFDPQTQLDENTIYTVTISTLVKDLAGNSMKEAYTFTFKTALFTETEKPYVVSRVPLDETELQIVFSERVTKETAEIKENYIFDHGLGVTKVELRDDGKTVHVFTLPQPEDVVYKVQVKNIQDQAGNTIDSATASFSFISIDPPNVLSAVAMNSSTLQVVFSEALGSASAQEVDNYFITPFLDVRKASLMSGDGTKVELETGGQTNGQLYELNASNVKDLKGNRIHKNNTAFFYGVN